MAEVQLSSVGGCTLGCDPEFFFTRAGKIIGAERVIPEEGLAGTYNTYIKNKALVLDGVQVELHTAAGSCRQGQAGQIANAFNVLKQHLKAHDKVKPSFEGVVTVPRHELNTLSEKAKVLGCAPSLNYYDKRARVGVKNPATYQKRSAGGHIHLGSLAAPVFKVRERLVPILDILLGNQCVLIDRDPRAAMRRRHYGRAGEFRLPKYGLEYRTLSNFWLHSYPLMSFVMGVARQAVYVMGTTVYADLYKSGPYAKFYFNAEQELLDLVHLPTVVKAINTNDLDLAYKSWEGVKEFLRKRVTSTYNGLTSDNIERFEFFVRKIQEEGLEFWWPHDPMKHWTGSYTSKGGWETFIGPTGTVSKVMAKGQAKEVDTQ